MLYLIIRLDSIANLQQMQPLATYIKYHYSIPVPLIVMQLQATYSQYLCKQEEIYTQLVEHLKYIPNIPIWILDTVL